MSNTREFIVRDAQGVVTPLYIRSGNVVTPVVNVASTGNVTQELQAGYHKVEEPQADPLELARGNKLMAIEDYDQSDNVNQFYLGGVPMWLDAPTRQQLRISIEAYQATGAETVTKWFEGQ